MSSYLECWLVFERWLETMDWARSAGFVRARQLVGKAKVAEAAAACRHFEQEQQTTAVAHMVACVFAAVAQVAVVKTVAALEAVREREAAGLEDASVVGCAHQTAG